MTDVLTIDELTGLLDRFGMKVSIDLDGAAADGVSAELVTARLAHALGNGVAADAGRAVRRSRNSREMSAARCRPSRNNGAKSTGTL